jgi:hypothetical protein
LNGRGRRRRRRRLPLPLLLGGLPLLLLLLLLVLVLLVLLLLGGLLLLLLLLLLRGLLLLLLLLLLRHLLLRRLLLLPARAPARRLPHRIVLVRHSEVDEGAAAIVGELPRQHPEGGITRGRRGIREEPRAIQALPTRMAREERGRARRRWSRVACTLQ